MSVATVPGYLHNINRCTLNSIGEESSGSYEDLVAKFSKMLTLNIQWHPSTVTNTGNQTLQGQNILNKVVLLSFLKKKKKPCLIPKEYSSYTLTKKLMTTQHASILQHYITFCSDLSRDKWV